MSTGKTPKANGNPAITVAAEPAALESVLRQHAEQQFAEELTELAKADDRQRPRPRARRRAARRARVPLLRRRRGVVRDRVERARAPVRDRLRVLLTR